MARIPYQLIVGDREMQQQTVAVRSARGDDLGAMSVDVLIGRIDKEKRYSADN